MHPLRNRPTQYWPCLFTSKSLLVLGNISCKLCICILNELQTIWILVESHSAFSCSPTPLSVKALVSVGGIDVVSPSSHFHLFGCYFISFNMRDNSSLFSNCALQSIATIKHVKKRTDFRPSIAQMKDPSIDGMFYSIAKIVCTQSAAKSRHSQIHFHFDLIQPVLLRNSYARMRIHSFEINISLEFCHLTLPIAIGAFELNLKWDLNHLEYVVFNLCSCGRWFSGNWWCELLVVCHRHFHLLESIWSESPSIFSKPA